VDAKGGITMHGVTVADVCRHLTLPLDRDVVDTGIAGTFDVRLELTMVDPFDRAIAPRPSTSATEPISRTC
jgi:hypothetical protein